MENAALSFIRHLGGDFKKCLIVCGKGNNGGDGYAIARQLYASGKEVVVFSIDSKNMSKDCQINYNICKNLKISMYDDFALLDELLMNSDIVVDAIFGTGLTSEVRGIYYKVIERINTLSKKVYSVDIPSGIDGNTGEVLGIAVRAYKTVSFVTYKKAFLNLKNRNYSGKIEVEGISLNKRDFLHLVNEYYFTEEMLKEKIIRRNEGMHKGNFGKILLYAGSVNFPGAGVISANSCVRAGAGLVSLMSYNSTFPSLLPEVMPISITDKNENEIERQVLNSDVVAIGPGIGKTPDSLKIMKKILSIPENEKGNVIKLVIDADGLNLLSENRDLFNKIGGRAILTPHLTEFSRLTGMTLEKLEKRGDFHFFQCKKFAEKHGAVLLLKGKNTVITNGKELYVNATGNSHMANGGMGDCLTGIITSLAGQGYSLMDSCNIGAFLHGYIGDELLKVQYIINASHIVDNMTGYMRKLFE